MTRDDSRTPGALLLLVVALVAGLILVPLLMMTLFHWSMGGMMGSPSGAPGLPVGPLLVAIGVVVVVAIVAVAAIRKGKREVVYVPQPIPAAPHPADVPVVHATAEPVPAPHPDAASHSAPPDDLEKWALRILEGDERVMFREILGGGGVALQKDLGLRSSFSRAKVTRILGKLENKGLVVRERAGMTNRVRIVLRDDA